MKYSFMSFSTPECSLPEMLKLAADYGYDAIEPRLDANHSHGVEVAASEADRETIRKTVADSGIALACLATSLRYANPADEEQVLADTHARIDLAGDVDCLRLRVFGGKIPEDVSREPAIEHLVKCLSAAADHAAKRDVTLCFETHDDWCDPAHVAAVVKQVNHPNIAVNWDIMHPVRTGKATMEEAFETLKPWIRHLHVHDGNGLDMKPIGEGEIDHESALRCLQTIDYDGYISGEWINWEPYDQHLPRELATLKRIEQEVS